MYEHYDFKTNDIYFKTELLFRNVPISKVPETAYERPFNSTITGIKYYFLILPILE